MSKAPAFQYYAKDHIATKASLTMAERGAWSTLVDHCWENGGPISMDVAVRLVGAELLESVRFVLLCENGTVTLEWVEQARARQAERSAANSVNGKRGGRGKTREARSKSERFTKRKQTESKTKPFRAEDEGEVEDTLSSGKERAHEPEIIPAGVSVELWDGLKRWGQYRKEKGNKLTPTGRAALLKKCLAMGDARSLAAIDHSIAQGWTGMYEPKEQQTNGKSDSFEDYTQRVAANFAEHIARKGYTD